MKKSILLTVCVLLSCSQGYTMNNTTFSITSPAFKQREAIPQEYTCDGADRSPQLSWSNAPEGTKSFALICDDPDAPHGIFVHWVVYNIPATKSGMPAGVPEEKILADGSMQGMTSFGKVGFGGPCPPSGQHRYFFKLYAVDTMLDLPAGASKDQVLAAMQGHVKAEVELVGVYSRKK